MQIAVHRPDIPLFPSEQQPEVREAQSAGLSLTDSLCPSFSALRQ